MKSHHLAIALSAVVLAAAAAFWFLSPPEEDDPFSSMSDEEILAAATEFYESRPYYERPFPYSEVPEGMADMRSETCGACHADVHAEWSVSTHARAYLDDAQFMEELAKSRGEYYEDQDTDYGWMCVNCHTPMINQLEQLVVGLEDDDIGRPIYVDNPFFDPEMQKDAIGCATCHVQDGVVHGPRGDTDAPHPVARAENLADERSCTRCHQAEAIYPNDVLGCFFTTGAEWEKSWAAEEDHACQDCHMPKTTRQLAEGLDLPERETRHHWFGGSLIPKHPDFEEEIAELLPIFGSGATLSLEPHPDEPCEEIDDDAFCIPLAIGVHNQFAGHLFPTGDPERHVEVEITVYNEGGDHLAEDSQWIGSRYQWYPEIKLLKDNRIPPGESLYIDVDWPKTDQKLIVEIVAHKFRM